MLMALFAFGLLRPSRHTSSFNWILEPSGHNCLELAHSCPVSFFLLSCIQSTLLTKPLTDTKPSDQVCNCTATPTPAPDGPQITPPRTLPLCHCWQVRQCICPSSALEPPPPLPPPQPTRPDPISFSLLQVSAVWHNMREEPVIYINGRPFVLREDERPFKNLQEYTGIDVRRLEQMELRLKNDILQVCLFLLKPWPCTAAILCRKLRL